MAAADIDWRKAFALQALSDLAARDKLAEASSEICHQLHFLQMASEKVCKAHLIEAKGYKNLQRRHDVIAKTLPVLAKQVFSTENEFNPKYGQRAAIQRMAHEIELLSPSCEEESRPDNSEYPWSNRDGEVQIPCLHSFSSLVDDRRTMIQVIQVIRRAAKRYAE
jgi:hypothetical protein